MKGYDPSMTTIIVAMVRQILLVVESHLCQWMVKEILMPAQSRRAAVRYGRRRADEASRRGEQTRGMRAEKRSERRRTGEGDGNGTPRTLITDAHE